MRSFRRMGDDVRMDLEQHEALLLVELRDDIRAALTDRDVLDPAMHRLFPPAVHGDDIADSDARLAFYDALLESRLAGLDALAQILERAEVRRLGRRRVLLVDDEPALVLGVLNDLRLALAARIGMDRVQSRELANDDPRRQGLAILDHLAWLQEQLVRVIDPAATAHQDDQVFRDLLDED